MATTQMRCASEAGVIRKLSPREGVGRKHCAMERRLLLFFLLSLCLSLSLFFSLLSLFLSLPPPPTLEPEPGIRGIAPTPLVPTPIHSQRPFLIATLPPELHVGDCRITKVMLSDASSGQRLLRRKRCRMCVPSTFPPQSEPRDVGDLWR